jgi:hypothetical protein
LNGIDFVDVNAETSPATLDIHFLFPLPGESGGVPSMGTPLTVDHLRIDGGVRITDLEVVSVSRSDRVLTVYLSADGDFSPYTLRLVAGRGSEDPHPDFDPKLSSVDVFLKVDCEQPFDCLEPACLPEETSSPVIDYTAKDYASFRRVMLERLAVLLPDGIDRNAADVQVALVELLAWSADRLSYYQDAVATEAYLATARQRISVRRHAALLDYTMHEGCNARAWVQVQVADGGTGAWLRRESAGSRTRIVARIPKAAVKLADAVFEDAWTSIQPAVFELLHDAWLQQSHNVMRLYTWGEEACCLPAGTTSAYLRDDPDRRLCLRVGDVIVFGPPFQATGADTAPEGLAAQRHAVRLTRVVPEATPLEESALAGQSPRQPSAAKLDPLTGESYVEIEWSEEDALPFDLVVARIETDGTVTGDLAVAHGNVVLADHGHTVALSAPVASHTVKGRLRLMLPIVDLSWSVPAPGTGTPAAASLTQDPRAATAALALTETAGEQLWQPVRTLLDSGPFDTHVVVEVDDDRVAHVRFGDGSLGRSPASGTTFGGTARTGNGTLGNVPPGALAHVTTPIVDGAAIVPTWVGNLTAADGGVDPEPTARVKSDAPVAFRTQLRAVTPADYAQVAELHPDTQRAAAEFRWTGSWHTVFITIDGKAGRALDDDFRAELFALLDSRRMAGVDVEIQPPTAVSLDIVLAVCVEQGFFRSDVREALMERFDARLHADGSRGYFHPDNFSFGDAVFLGPIVAAAMEIPGVAWVDASVGSGLEPPNRFQRWGDGDHGELASGVIKMAFLEVARCDSDPNYPENGVITFTLDGGL